MKKSFLSLLTLIFTLTGNLSYAVAGAPISPSSTTPTQIYFENLSQVDTYTVYWADFAGVEKKYYTLTPLESYTQNTYL
jgi:hypothetical protein